jgi:hypothetical protein
MAVAVCNDLSEAQPKVTLCERHNGVDCECCIKLQDKLIEVLLELSSTKKKLFKYSMKTCIRAGKQNSEGMLVREVNYNTTWKQVPLALKKCNNKPVKHQIIMLCWIT